MVSLTGYSNSLSVTTDETDDDLVGESLEVFKEGINTHKPRTLKQSQNTISYTAGVMRPVLNVNLLYGISEGEIKIEKKDRTLIIHYVIKFYEMIALSIIPAIGTLVIIDSVEGKLIGLLLVIFIFYGGNVLITILRYKSFIRNTIKHWLSNRNTVVINEEQKEWINNINKCDACGSAVSATDAQCPDCGLRLR